MNSFSTIKANVGTRIGDTSTSFATTVGGYINQRYQRIFKKFNWDSIKPDYTFNTVAGTNDYILESGFSKPIYVFDNTNSIDLQELSIQELEKKFGQNLGDNGNPLYYAVYRTLDTSTPANIVIKVRLYPNPASVIQILMPYLRGASILSASTDLPILEMSDLAAEIGATADAWRTKRQFSKASDFELQYEQIINEMIWSQENQPNTINQFTPKTFNRDLLY